MRRDSKIGGKHGARFKLGPWIIYAASCLCVLTARPVAGAEMTVGTPALRVIVDDKNGALRQFSAGKLALASNEDPSGDLWEIGFLDEPGRTLRSSDAHAFRCKKPLGKSSVLTMRWSRFGGLNNRLVVEAEVQGEAGPPSVFRWKFRVSGLEGRTMARVHFPRLLNLSKQPGEVLAVPIWMGQQAENPRQLLWNQQGNGKRLEWAYPGLLSMQCLAYYAREGAGIYVACNDPRSLRKNFSVFATRTNEASLEIVHLPERTEKSAGDWVLPYEVITSAFEGDWVTAAEQYRAWAQRQDWAKQSRLHQGAVPPWLLDTGLWIWNRGRSSEVLDPALEMQTRLRLPVSVFWHWWHGCSYDTGFPEYFPPREGTEPFEAALKSAQAKGLHAIVYMNQRLWGERTESWRKENAERFAVKGTSGKIEPEIYNTFTKAPCVSMCMGTPFWRKKYATLAEQALKQLGVDGIYMDQACTSLTCYDPNHPHPAGGGAYWINGFREMAADIRTRCSDSGSKPLLLAGEGCGESWLPHLDLMLSLQVSKERYAGPDGWEPIPFFHAVYHPFVITYGNYASLTMPPYDDLWPTDTAPREKLKLLDQKFSDQFLFEQARAFVWGQQPTLANFLPEHFFQRPREIDYVMELARLRKSAAKFLVRGEFLRPPDIHAPRRSINMSRLSIYAGQQGGLKDFEQEVPGALSGAWRANDGSVGIVLANITDEDLALAFRMESGHYRLRSGARMKLSDTRSQIGFGRYDPDHPIQLTLPARGACVLEIKN